MDPAQTTEYAVHLSQREVDGMERWQAFVETFPEIAAEGDTCDSVLQEIARKLQSNLSGDDSITFTITASEQKELSREEMAELKAEAQAKGHKFLGIFADDPDAMEVFAEIERQRDQHTIGG